MKPFMISILFMQRVLMPPLQALCKFRESVRSMALRAEKSVPERAALLQLCDELRDDVLPELGIKLEDYEG